MTQRLNQRAFSVIEMMLVLGLIALTMSLIVINFDSLLERFSGGRSFQANLESVIRTARLRSYQTHQPVHLRYDVKKQAYQLLNDANQELKSIYFKIATDKAPKSITFYVLEEKSSNKGPTLKQISFFPDGSSHRSVIECAFQKTNKAFKLEPFQNTLLKFP